MERIRKKKKDVGLRWGSGSYSYRRMGYWLVVVTTCCLALGCTTLKKAAVTSIVGAGGGAVVGTVLSGGAVAPILGATTGAFVTDVVMEVKTPQKITQGGDMNCAPDNFWTLLGNLIEMGGWALILIVIIPMIFSWLLPGPIKFKGRDKNPGNPYLK